MDTTNNIIDIVIAILLQIDRALRSGGVCWEVQEEDEDPEIANEIFMSLNKVLFTSCIRFCLIAT